jgi:hypothetical protein
MPSTRARRTTIDDAKAAAGQLNTGPRLVHAHEGAKTYTSLNQATVPRLPFNLEVFRNGSPEVHGFTAAPVMDLGSVLMFMRGHEDEMGQALLRLMLVNLVDDDGVPADWSVQMTERPKNAGADWQPKFRAPGPPAGDGRLHSMADAARYTDPNAGSSRRRWSHLMFEDDGVIVSAEVILEIMKDLMAQAAGLPTDGS